MKCKTHFTSKIISNGPTGSLSRITPLIITNNLLDRPTRRVVTIQCNHLFIYISISAFLMTDCLYLPFLSHTQRYSVSQEVSFHLYSLLPSFLSRRKHVWPSSAKMSCQSMGTRGVPSLHTSVLTNPNHASSVSDLDKRLKIKSSSSDDVISTRWPSGLQASSASVLVSVSLCSW